MLLESGEHLLCSQQKYNESLLLSPVFYIEPNRATHMRGDILHSLRVTCNCGNQNGTAVEFSLLGSRKLISKEGSLSFPSD